MTTYKAGYHGPRRISRTFATTALTRCENLLSSSGSVYYNPSARENKAQCETNLSTTQLIVRRQIEDVHHKLWYSIASDPEEHCLTVLNEEKTVSLEALA